MYSSAFIFEPGDYDEAFYSLDNQIHEAAASISGFLGRESWQSADGKRRNATYYWESMDALKAFSRHPKHLEAKRQYTRWYQGFHVVISEIQCSYGDGKFSHITPNNRAKMT
jgi:heme-degrading monooxygenase HmoA